MWIFIINALLNVIPVEGCLHEKLLNLKDHAKKKSISKNGNAIID